MRNIMNITFELLHAPLATGSPRAGNSQSRFQGPTVLGYLWHLHGACSRSGLITNAQQIPDNFGVLSNHWLYEWTDFINSLCER